MAPHAFLRLSTTDDVCHERSAGDDRGRPLHLRFLARVPVYTVLPVRPAGYGHPDRLAPGRRVAEPHQSAVRVPGGPRLDDARGDGRPAADAPRSEGGTS